MAWPLASEIALRRRGLPLGSPPPMRAATVSSLMSFVKSLPRLASSAPFLCLIVAHLEGPLMGVPRAVIGRANRPVGALHRSGAGAGVQARRKWDESATKAPQKAKRG